MEEAWQHSPLNKKHLPNMGRSVNGSEENGLVQVEYSLKETVTSCHQ